LIQFECLLLFDGLASTENTQLKMSLHEAFNHYSFVQAFAELRR